MSSPHTASSSSTKSSSSVGEAKLMSQSAALATTNNRDAIKLMNLILGRLYGGNNLAPAFLQKCLCKMETIIATPLSTVLTSDDATSVAFNSCQAITSKSKEICRIRTGTLADAIISEEQNDRIVRLLRGFGYAYAIKLWMLELNVTPEAVKSILRRIIGSEQEHQLRLAVDELYQTLHQENYHSQITTGSAFGQLKARLILAFYLNTEISQDIFIFSDDYPRFIDSQNRLFLCIERLFAYCIPHKDQKEITGLANISTPELWLREWVEEAKEQKQEPATSTASSSSSLATTKSASVETSSDTSSLTAAVADPFTAEELLSASTSSHAITGHSTLSSSADLSASVSSIITFYPSFSASASVLSLLPPISLPPPAFNTNSGSTNGVSLYRSATCVYSSTSSSQLFFKPSNDPKEMKHTDGSLLLAPPSAVLKGISQPDEKLLEEKKSEEKAKKRKNRRKKKKQNQPKPKQSKPQNSAERERKKAEQKARYLEQQQRQREHKQQADMRAAEEAKAMAEFRQEEEEKKKAASVAKPKASIKKHLSEAETKQATVSMVAASSVFNEMPTNAVTSDATAVKQGESAPITVELITNNEGGIGDLSPLSPNSNLALTPFDSRARTRGNSDHVTIPPVDRSISCISDLSLAGADGSTAQQVSTDIVESKESSSFASHGTSSTPATTNDNVQPVLVAQSSSSTVVAHDDGENMRFDQHHDSESLRTKWPYWETFFWKQVGSDVPSSNDSKSNGNQLVNDEFGQLATEVADSVLKESNLTQ